MSRSQPEWVGKTDDAKIPPRVRLRIFRAHNGICHLAKRKIMPGEPWDVDHVIALCNGGRHAESNMAPALRDKHREKTATDVAERARTDRKQSKMIGLKRSTRPMPGSRNSPWKAKVGGGWERRT